MRQIGHVPCLTSRLLLGPVAPKIGGSHPRPCLDVASTPTFRRSCAVRSGQGVVAAVVLTTDLLVRLVCFIGLIAIDGVFSAFQGRRCTGPAIAQVARSSRLASFLFYHTWRAVSPGRTSGVA